MKIEAEWHCENMIKLVNSKCFFEINFQSIGRKKKF